MLQNRVDPFGRIITTPARGSWTGNRGVLHNEHKRIVAHYKTQAWIICRLEFKGRKREVMTPGRWTELFFLDEATALAAGHRPCFECRREDAVLFKSCWIAGNPAYNFSMKTAIKEIDSVIHQERIFQKQKVTYNGIASDLVDGCFVTLEGKAYVVKNGSAHQWTPHGYGEQVKLAAHSRVTILTPRSIVNALRAGYVPQMNLS
ncbi:MAG TPA: hypothetical protein VGD40_06255 [Chryseosolibacter sp.]